MSKRIFSIGLFLSVCSLFSGCDEDENARLFSINPENVILNEGSNSTITFMLEESPSSTVTLKVASSDETAIIAQPAQVIVMDKASPAQITVSCIEDNQQTGDRVAMLSFTMTSNDKTFNQKMGTALVICSDNDYDGGKLTPYPVQTDPNNTTPQQDPAQTNPVQTDPVQTDPVQPDPVQTDPVQTDPVQTDPVQTDPVQTDPVQTDPVQTDPVQTDPIQTDPIQTDPVQTDPVQTDPVQTDPVQPDPVQPDPVQPDPIQNPVGTPGVNVSHQPILYTSETGLTASFTVVLTGEPTIDVTIPVYSLDYTEGVTSTSLLYFSPSNWNIPQTVTVTGIDDIELDGDISYTVNLGPVSSYDERYDGMIISEVVVLTNLDNEEPSPVTPTPQGIPGVQITPTDGLITNELGQSASFTMVLTGEPLSSVIIPVISNDVSEGIVSANSLVFTPTNWNIPQTVTVFGMDDTEYDGDIVYTISFGSFQSDDDRYHLMITNTTVRIVNIDNDEQPYVPAGTPGILVAPKQGLVTSESGQNASFSVMLTGEPLADVHVPLTSSDTSEGILNSNELVFTPHNWNNAQTVTIYGVNDIESDGDMPYYVELGPLQSTDSRYNQMEVDDFVFLTNIDDDEPNIPASFTITASNLTVSESGTPVTFTIVPDTKPMYNITVSLYVSDTTEGSVSPSMLTFTPDNWTTPQTVTVSGVSDQTVDGTQTFNLTFSVASGDSRFNGLNINPLAFTVLDSDITTGETVKIRAMAANITSGNDQSYSPGHGIRIFQALKPDVVMIQEFNMYDDDDSDDDIRKLVDMAFGPEFYYHHGNGQIPNGIISRYPILSSGYWKSNKINNRNWDWAVIDLPGPKELLVVSVHLSTDDNAQEMPQLMKKIEGKIQSDKGIGMEYFVMLGGDFNTKSRSSVQTNMKSVFQTKGTYPMDQDGNTNTNASRSNPYDYLLCSYEWCEYEVPISIGTHTYQNGHVFDSRVYSKHNELSYVSPVKAKDSDAANMQHMAVIRDFVYTY